MWKIITQLRPLMLLLMAGLVFGASLPSNLNSVYDRKSNIVIVIMVVVAECIMVITALKRIHQDRSRREKIKRTVDAVYITLMAVLFAGSIWFKDGIHEAFSFISSSTFSLYFVFVGFDLFFSRHDLSRTAQLIDSHQSRS
jgi:hypothetical protein